MIQGLFNIWLAVQQAFGQFVRHPGGGAFFGLGVGVDFRQAGANVRQVRGDGGQFGATVLEGDVDQAAGVDHVVGGVEDAPCFQLIGVVQVGQLRAGGTGDGGAAQLADALAVEYGAQAAGGQDVAGGAEQCIVGDGVRAQLLHGQLHLAMVDVAHQQLGTCGVQLLGQRVTDVAQALHGHAQAFEVVTAQARHGGGADTGEYAHGSMGRRVARRRGAGDETGVLGDAVHVGHRGATVDGGDEAPVEFFEAAAKGFEQRGAAFHVHWADNHRRAAAHRQASQGGLVAHALGQARGIRHGTFVVGVGEVATATQGGPETAVVDGDDRLQPGNRVDAQVQRFKAGAVHESKHRQAPESLLVVAQV